MKISQSRRGRWSAFGLSVLLASVGLASVSLPAQAADSGSVNVDLSGTWKFIKGDDPSYATTGLDDSSWMDLTVPEDGSQWASYDGFGWYRLSFDLPADAAGKNLVASLGFIDDVDEAYLNGVKIGSSGQLPPNADSQWFEKRLYPVPANAPVFGGKNTLAVRVYDINGGGGWYKGPIGIYSKDQVRENVYGITGDVAPASIASQVQAVLDEQKAALAAGDVDRYLATLDSSYVHDGTDKAQRKAEMTKWVEESGTLALKDGEVEVVQASDGRLLVDTNRSITGTRNGAAYDYQTKTQEFLSFDPTSYREIGNHSRFFRETVDSKLEGKQREFMVYLPPSYYTEPNRKFPVVYLLHGINGGSREWEPREMDKKLDALAGDGIAESIVVMPDGESLWYVDSANDPWRSMFLGEMVPQVDGQYRTLASPEFRALSGVSMGGFGAWSIGLDNPDKFSSIASHIGALSFAMGGKQTPLAQVASMTTEQLSKYSYYFDACEEDEYRFDNAARTMDANLTAKGVAHTWIVYPTGRHNDDCWVPNIKSSFGMHSDHWRAEGLQEDWVAPAISVGYGDATPSEAGWFQKPVTVSVTIDDAADAAPTVEYNLDGAGWMPYTAGITIADGTHSLAIRATDAAGNVSDKTVTVRVDSEAPVSSASFNPAERTVSLRGADSLSGIASLQYNNGSAWVDYTGPIQVGADAATLQYRAVDKAGNVESANSINVPPSGTVLKPSTTAAVIKYSSRTYGGANSISVKVAGIEGVPSGQVRVLSQGTLVAEAVLSSSGAAKISLGGSALPAGKHTLTVEYLGDATFAASSDTVVVTVAKVATAVRASFAQSTVSTGKRARVTVTVVSVARVTGTVSVRMGSKVLTSAVSVSGKKVILTLPKLKRGNHSITVLFSHAPNAVASSKKLVLRVK